jgi:hypothetical protein
MVYNTPRATCFSSFAIIRCWVRKHPDQRPNEILRSLIFESAQVLKSDARAET